MNKVIRILLNLLIFAMVIGFVGYMVYSLGKGESFSGNNVMNNRNEEISPYKKINAIQVKSNIITFDLSDNNIYVAVNQEVMIYDMAGTLVRQFPVEKEIRDLKVEDNRIYLLYPSEIEVYTCEGEKIFGRPARRAESDYCSMALSAEFIFVTDAGNYNICKYTKEGDYLDIILSPIGFIIPSYAFDIINIRDTIYCSNSGRHRIESYTLEGQYIDSFGKAGSEAGSFAGCCNPGYLAATANGDIITSEKGEPRISCFGRDGTFRTILFGSKALGGGTEAYKVKMHDDKIYIAGKKSLSVYVFDPELATQTACADCPADCPLKK